MSKINIMDLFSEGEENAITARELAKILDWNVREVTICINALRNSGEVICSTERGYFLPASIEEVKHFCRTMDSRQREIKRATKSAKDYLKRYGGEV